MRQLTEKPLNNLYKIFSKLPMRQLTIRQHYIIYHSFSKLPMRQLTAVQGDVQDYIISKLPMRQLTMPERKKNLTARALIHLFSTLTQIYSCFEIY